MQLLGTKEQNKTQIANTQITQADEQEVDNHVEQEGHVDSKTSIATRSTIKTLTR